jgi:hypothetical protein
MTHVSRLLIVAVAISAVPAAAGGPDAERLRARVDVGAVEAIALYRELLRYPNDALFPDDMAEVVDNEEELGSRRCSASRRSGALDRGAPG